VPHHVGLAADIAGVGQAGDRAQCQLIAAAGDHDRWAGFLHRLRLEDRILDVKIPAVKGRSLLRPHREDQSNGFLHLPDAHCWAGRELPAILAVFGLEIARTDAEGQPSSADQVDTGGDLGQMRGIAVADRCGKCRETNAACHRGQRRQDGPALHERLIGLADAANLDQVVHHREPNKAVVFGPLRLRLHCLECSSRIGAEEPGRVVNAELHQDLPRLETTLKSSVAIAATKAVAHSNDKVNLVEAGRPG
jgi:hypothetical protein